MSSVSPPDTENTDHLLVHDISMNDVVARVLTLHRPARRNALDSALMADLLAALTAADDDPQVRAVVLAGHGAMFCAGGDLKEFRDLPNARERMIDRAGALTQLLALPRRMSTPVVAAVNGAALGAGAALALACDLIVAGDDMVLGFPEITDSVVPAVVMAGAVGALNPRLAFQMLTQGRRLTAQQADQHNLTVAVVAPDQTLDTALQTVAFWGRITPEAVGETKQLFYRVSDMPYEAGLRAGLDVTTKTWAPKN